VERRRRRIKEKGVDDVDGKGEKGGRRKKGNEK
jgi:hypothetical protein